MFGQQQHPQAGGLGMRDGVNLIYLLVSGHATCITPFVRRSFGRDALGRNAAVALLILLGYSAVYPRDEALVVFGALWFVMFIAQRLKTVWLLNRGTVMHSRDDGYPWLGFLIPLVKRDKTACAIEFFAVLLFGLWLSNYDTALSRLIVVSAVSLAIKTSMEEEIFRRRLQAMRDAEIEQRATLERYRRGDF